MLGIDITTPSGGIPTTNGFRHLLTATDYYTKWVEAFPLKDKSAESVVKCLLEMFYRHGASTYILTDQGREFVNQVNWLRVI